MSKPTDETTAEIPESPIASGGGMELLAWGLFVVGIATTFFAGFGLLICVAAIGLLVGVAIAEGRDSRREMRRRLEVIEARLTASAGHDGETP